MRFIPANQARRILIWLMFAIFVRAVIEFFGFDTGTRINDELDGVKITVIHPRFVDFRWSKTGVFSDAQIRHGFQATYQWTEPFGTVRKDRHVVDLVDFKLRIDGRDYGTVSQGDSVLINGPSVKVAKSTRLPQK